MATTGATEQAELSMVCRRARNIAATRRSKGQIGHEFSYLLLKAGPGQWRGETIKTTGWTCD